MPSTPSGIKIYKAMVNPKSMDFETQPGALRWGERVGFVFSYFVFTTVLYFILTFLGKFSGAYFVIMGVTLVIAFIGWLLKRYVL